MLKAVFLLSEEAFASAYGPAVMARLRPQIDLRAVIVPGEQWRNQRAAVGQAEVIFAGWGAPRMDEDFFRAAPQVRAIFYAGGSVRYFVTDAMWQRNVRLTTAQASNAAPVAEYTLSAILLGLKRFWHYARLTRATRTFPAERPMPGAYGAEVGLISYGAIARLLRQKLAGFDVNVQVYDPFLTAEEAAREKVRKVSLDELCATCDVVSLHTPHLAETNGLLRARHFERMKPGAVFINTARGEIVHEAEMIAVLQRRPDLQAVLDVTAPEPPAEDSPLYTLPNVVLTPHIAGSVGAECLRMGHAMVDEFERFVAGQPMLWEVTSDRAALLA